MTEAQRYTDKPGGQTPVTLEMQALCFHLVDQKIILGYKIDIRVVFLFFNLIDFFYQPININSSKDK